MTVAEGIFVTRGSAADGGGASFQVSAFSADIDRRALQTDTGRLSMFAAASEQSRRSPERRRKASSSSRARCLLIVPVAFGDIVC